MWRGNHRRAHAATVFFIAIVLITIAAVPTLRVDAYVLDTLMADLVLHDRQPSAFLVYLQLWHRSRGRTPGVRVSHQQMAHLTGLSKSAVQAAVRTLVRRRLIRVSRASSTAVPQYVVLHPWRSRPC